MTNHNFGTHILILQGYNNSKGVTLEASFTPDSQFVMIGKNNLLCLISLKFLCGKKRFLTQNLYDFSHFTLKWNLIKEVLRFSNDDFEYFSIFKALRMERSMCGMQRVV